MNRKEGKEHPTIFISYSHKDEKWKDYLVPHLKMLPQECLLEIWDDRQIGYGADWYDKIKVAMARADVAICLISADYLSSDFCVKEEIPCLLGRRQNEGMLLIPVLVRPCFWKVIPWLGPIQMIPRDGKSVAVDFKETSDIVFTELAGAIFDFLKTSSVKKLAAEAPKWEPPEKIDIDRLPQTGKELFGRQKELQLLDKMWDSDETGLVSFVAWGGVGKSTLINKWLERMKIDNYRGAKRVFGLTFYSQGTNELVSSADTLIKEALTWFGDPNPTAGSPWDKGKRLADLIRRNKTLLILDGIEPLQSSLEKGKIKDASLAILVNELARSNPGLCIITTRENIPELKHHKKSAVEINLEQISPEAGRALLRVAGVQGTDEQLEQATREFGNHALAINLLASYLHGIPGHHISNAAEIADIDVPVEKGRHPRRVMEAFDKRFGKGAKGEILRIMGLFDRPAELAAIGAVRTSPAIAGLTEYLQEIKETEWNKLLEELRNCKLLAQESKHNPDVIDCHPLVREHFGEKLEKERIDAWREGHGRLYEYYKGVPKKELPDTLEEMEPLFRAVYHGCAAGRYQETFDDVYWKRIKRGKEHYSTAKLGAFGSDLGAVACFFERCWDKPAVGLSEQIKALVLNFAGYRLRGVGRLREAAEPLKAAFNLFEKQGNWKEVASNANNFSELYLALGEVKKAIEYGHRGVEYADKSRDRGMRLMNRATLADALHQAGQFEEESKRLFEEAEEIQKEREPEHRYLYSMRGYKYCDLLLAEGKTEKVKERVELSIEIAKRNKWLLDIALDKLSLGRAELAEAASKIKNQKLNIKNVEKELIEAKRWLDEAVDGLRKAGGQDHLPRGLLARAGYYRAAGDYEKAWGDLEEVKEIAERGEMKLWLADYHLEAGRVCKAEGKDVKEHIQKARELIETCGYHRRDKELEELEQI